ncbi:fidgetin isoform X1 [Tachysurus ichikawai]
MRCEQRAVLLHGAAVWGLKFQHGRGSGQSSPSLTWNGFRSSAPARSPSSRRPSASLSDRCRSDLRRSPVTHAGKTSACRFSRIATIYKSAGLRRSALLFPRVVCLSR